MLFSWFLVFWVICIFRIWNPYPTHKLQKFFRIYFTWVFVSFVLQKNFMWHMKLRITYKVPYVIFTINPLWVHTCPEMYFGSSFPKSLKKYNLYLLIFRTKLCQFPLIWGITILVNNTLLPKTSSTPITSSFFFFFYLGFLRLPGSDMFTYWFRVLFSVYVKKGMCVLRNFWSI